MPNSTEVLMFAVLLVQDSLLDQEDACHLKIWAQTVIKEKNEAGEGWSPSKDLVDCQSQAAQRKEGYRPVGQCRRPWCLLDHEEDRRRAPGSDAPWQADRP